MAIAQFPACLPEVAMIDPARRTLHFLGKGEGLDIGSTWLGAYGQTRDGLLMFGGTYFQNYPLVQLAAMLE